MLVYGILFYFSFFFFSLCINTYLKRQAFVVLKISCLCVIRKENKIWNGGICVICVVLITFLSFNFLFFHKKYTKFTKKKFLSEKGLFIKSAELFVSQCDGVCVCACVNQCKSRLTTLFCNPCKIHM